METTETPNKEHERDEAKGEENATQSNKEMPKLEAATTTPEEEENKEEKNGEEGGSTTKKRKLDEIKKESIV